MQRICKKGLIQRKEEKCDARFFSLGTPKKEKRKIKNGPLLSPAMA